MLLEKAFNHTTLNRKLCSITNLNLVEFFQGKRPLLEELKFEDDVNQERFKTVKRMLEKFWDGDHNNRPTMEIVVSCFVIESGKVLDLDIGSLFENNQLSKLF